MTLSTEQLESLRRHLAEKVMGWELKPDELGFQIYYNEKGVAQAALKNTYWENLEEYWNPSENFEQAMMCLGAFDNWSINQYPDGELSVEIIYNNKSEIMSSEDLPMAISLACAKATGWE